METSHALMNLLRNFQTCRKKGWTCLLCGLGLLLPAMILVWVALSGGRGAAEEQSSGSAPGLFSMAHCRAGALHFMDSYTLLAPKGHLNNWYQLLEGLGPNRNIIPQQLQTDLVFAATQSHVAGIHNATLWYVGGNTHCEVGLQLLAASPGFSRMVVYEPVPSFYKQLTLNVRHERVNIQLRPYGIGKTTGNMSVPIAGKSTSSLGGIECDKVDNANCEILQVRELVSALQQDRFERGADNMLYTNCEGCEVSLMEALLDAGLASAFKLIHLATHAVNVDFVERHCHNCAQLSRTHDLQFKVMFAQERWVRKAEQARSF